MLRSNPIAETIISRHTLQKKKKNKTDRAMLDNERNEKQQAYNRTKPTIDNARKYDLTDQDDLSIQGRGKASKREKQKGAGEVGVQLKSTQLDLPYNPVTSHAELLTMHSQK